MPSTDEWVKKKFTFVQGILLSYKKEWNNAICSNMDGPRDYHSKGNKSDRKRQISYDIPYMWNLKKWYKWTYLQNRNRLTDVENKLMIIKGEGWGEGINYEVCISINICSTSLIPSSDSFILLLNFKFGYCVFHF